jgi:hypothetical protein
MRTLTTEDSSQVYSIVQRWTMWPGGKISSFFYFLMRRGRVCPRGRFRGQSSSRHRSLNSSSSYHSVHTAFSALLKTAIIYKHMVPHV